MKPIHKLLSALDDWRMYKAYQRFCRLQGESPLAFRAFRQETHNVFKQLVTSMPRNEGEFEVALRKLIGDCK